MYRKIILLILFSIITAFNPLVSQIVRIAEDSSEWAPYTYFERDRSGNMDIERITGAVPELIALIFKRMEMEYRIDVMPWSRALVQVAAASPQEILPNGLYTPERGEKFWYTTPVYASNRGLFYSKKRFPDGLPFDNPSLQMIGVKGYSYDTLTHWPINTEFEKKVDDYSQAMRMILNGRGDFFIANIDIIYGGEKTGAYKIPDDLAYFKVEWEAPLLYYFLISKKSDRGCELLTKINQQLIDLHFSGELQKIFRKYIPGYIDPWYPGRE